MFYLLYGSDFKKSREKLRGMVDSLLKKKPDASFFKLDISNFSEGQLEELISGQGLFEQKYIVQIDGLLEDKKSRDFVLDKIDEIAQSENIFIFIEENLDKVTLKKIEKIAQKVQEFDKKESGGRKFGVMGDLNTLHGQGWNLNLKEFNIFDIADALGRKDKKELWVLLQKAIQRNIPTEEIHRILLWQIKTILIAQKSKDESESGLKTFVYNKSLRFSKNFREGELEKILSRLISIYHDARRGLCEFEVEMERFVLEI